jgi:hypothetical protein
LLNFTVRSLCACGKCEEQKQGKEKDARRKVHYQ